MKRPAAVPITLIVAWLFYEMNHRLTTSTVYAPKSCVHPPCTSTQALFQDSNDVTIPLSQDKVEDSKQQTVQVDDAPVSDKEQSLDAEQTHENTETEVIEQNLPVCDPKLDCTKEGLNSSIFNVDNTTKHEISDLETKFSNMQKGGIWAPPGCISRPPVAIMVIFRDREEHLKILLNNLIPFLQAQMTSFRLFLLEQGPGQLFNRAALLNAGFILGDRFGKFDCFIYHDVDLLPQNLCNIYTCADGQLRSMATSMDKYGYKPMYPAYCGGVIAMNRTIMQSINGLSNIMFGWGGEDDDIFYRVRRGNFTMTRYEPDFARYTMIKHDSDSHNPKSGRTEWAAHGHWIYAKYDGLKQAKFTVQNVEERPLFTRIVITFDGGPNSVTEAEDLYVGQRQHFRELLINDKEEQDNLNNIAKRFKETKVRVWADLDYNVKTENTSKIIQHLPPPTSRPEEQNPPQPQPEAQNPPPPQQEQKPETQNPPPPQQDQKPEAQNPPPPQQEQKPEAQNPPPPQQEQKPAQNPPPSQQQSKPEAQNPPPPQQEQKPEAQNHPPPQQESKPAAENPPQAPAQPNAIAQNPPAA